jgi:hypothetical protein
MLVEAVGERKVELVCAECGYGIVVTSVPPACPMCRATSWDLPAWRPFSGLAAYRQTFEELDEPEVDEAPLYRALTL